MKITLETNKPVNYRPYRLAASEREVVRVNQEGGYGREYGRKAGCLHPIEKAAIPFDTVHIDHLEPFSRSSRGNSYILVVVDGFTKFTLIKATKTVSTAETVTKLREVFGEFGYPRRVISDRGLAFTSKAFASFVPERGAKHVLNAIATPRANGQVERQNRTILDALATDAEDELSWDEKLPDVMWDMNNMANSATGVSPAQLMFTLKRGRMADLSEGVKAANDNGASFEAEKQQLLNRRRRAKENLDRAGEKMRTRYDKRRKVATEYQKGDLVLWRGASTTTGDKGVNRKLSNRYDGPYRINKALGSDRYKITTVKGVRGYKKFTAVVASDSLRRYYSSAGGAENVTGDNDIGDGTIGEVRNVPG
ncbi:Integrase core domain [Popillia japonica]|uniref:Integrase core domain n=1 Tax=Popillia japonica TaxID=7064 RepID=A0AAW1JET4_POPJA